MHTEHIDRAILIWTTFKEHLLFNMPENKQAVLEGIDRENDKAWVAQHLEDQVTMVGATLKSLEGLKATAQTHIDAKEAYLIVQIAALKSIECFQAMMLSDDTDEQGDASSSARILEKYQEMAAELCEEIQDTKAKAMRVVEMIRDNSVATLPEVPPVSPIENTDDSLLPPDMQAVKKILSTSGASLEKMRDIHMNLSSHIPELYKESFRFVEYTTLAPLKEVSEGRFDKIEKRYDSIRFLAAHGPQILGFGIEWISQVEALAPVLETLFSGVAHKVTVGPMHRAEMDAKHRAEMCALEVLPLFILPFCICTHAHLKFSESRLRHAHINSMVDN